MMLITVSFAGCLGGNGTVVTDEGDPITPGELPDDWPTYYVATANDLPTCDTNTLGRLYYVEADTNFQACTSNGWTVVQIGGSSSSPTLTINQPPLLSAHIWLGDDDLMAFDGDGTATKHIFLDWFSSDSDGSITSVGVDTDGDGIIDITLPSNSGMFADGIFQFEPGEYLNGTIEIPLEVGNTIYRAQDWGEDSCALFISKNFFVIATDDDGATTTEIISAFEGDHNEYLVITLDDVVNGWDGLNVADAFGISVNDIAWLSSTNCDIPGSSNTSTNEYKAEDHPTATTSGSDDNLMRLTFTHGLDNLEWALLIIILFDEEDGTSYTCTPGGYDCDIGEETADSIWEGSEVISIKEGGSTNICGQAGAGGDEGTSCQLKISIQYDGSPIAGTSGVVAVA
jgi:hypothetical protein